MDSRSPSSRLPAVVFILVVLVAGLVAGAYYLAPRFEREAPRITLTPDSDVLGPAPIDIGVTDEGAGVKSITATLFAGGTELPIAADEYAHPVRAKTISIALPKLPGVKEGPAVLRVSARDGSLWKFFRGNETVLQKEFTIDLTPPTVELVAEDRYVKSRRRGCDRLQGLRRYGHERSEARRAFLPRFQRTGERRAGPLHRAFRPSLRRARRRQEPCSSRPTRQAIRGKCRLSTSSRA
jgi:hypothetical protein